MACIRRVSHRHWYPVIDDIRLNIDNILCSCSCQRHCVAVLGTAASALHPALLPQQFIATLSAADALAGPSDTSIAEA